MTHDDLTIIYLTQNLLPEEWMKYQQEVLLKSVDQTPIVVVSRKPTIIGENSINIIQTEPASLSNIYWQILKACKQIKTPYVGICEDDSLYNEEHYMFRPRKRGIFCYNLSHWSLFTWGVPTYGWRNRRGNWTMIAHKDDVIEALEERYAKYPEGTPDVFTGEIGRAIHEKNLGVTIRHSEDFYTTAPIINFNHVYAMDDRQRRKHKTIGTLRAYDIPVWGPASELVKHFK